MPGPRHAETERVSPRPRTNIFGAPFGAVVFAAALALGGCVPVAGRVPTLVRAAPRTTAVVKPATTKPAAKKLPPAKPAPVLNRANAGVSFYGSVLSWSRADLASDLDRVRAMGATWVRIPLNWVTLEQQRHQYNWGPADTIVAEAAARHLKIDAVVSYTP